MVVFLDTSLAYAVADEGDPHHQRASELLRRAMDAGETVLLHNYLVVEAVSLLQRRLGLDSAFALLESLDAFEVHWVTADEHLQAIALLRARRRRALSFCDCVSFVVMTNLGIRQALAFDDDFEREGFALYSGG